MKKNKAPTSFLNMGTSSLLVTFIILCLAIFATLSLSGAKADYDFSLRLADQTQAYYEACSVSEKALATLDGILQEQAALSHNPQDYFDKTLTSLDNEIKDITIEHKLTEDKLLLSWSLPFSEGKSLYVSVSVSYPPGNESKHYYQILAWQSMPNDSSER